MKRHLLATATCASKRYSKAAAEECRREFEQRLRGGLAQPCEVTRKGRKIFVHVSGDFTEAQLDHLASGVARVWEWEAA
jgi:hypothetical protein